MKPLGLCACAVSARDLLALLGAALIGAAPGAAGAQAVSGGMAPAVVTTASDASAPNAPAPNAPAPNAPDASQRRPEIPPAPLEAPPWPWTDWPFGGAPLIGGATPNSSGDSLMKALSGTPTADFLKDNHIEIWGWIDGGINLSTSHHGNGNFPAGYDFNPNTAELNQAVVYIERVPDTVQQDHLDWGFRISNLYGTDYRNVTMEGIFSDQLTRHNDRYGYTPANFYVDLYIPWVGQGSDLRVGRYTTLGDIEADLDYQSVFDTHSLYYTYDPFTQFGFVWTTRLSKNWVVQGGLNASNDVAPWEHDAKLTVTGCVQWSSDSSRDTVYLCANGTNNARYGFNNVNLYQIMYYHKFTDRLWVATEEYYEYQKDVPTTSTIPGANGAMCPAPATQCAAGAYAASVYAMYQLTGRDYVGLRGEGFYDVRGQRTGFATWYNETTLAFVHWLTPSMEIRPEVRYDHSYAAAAYDNGLRHDQLQFAADILIKY